MKEKIERKGKSVVERRNHRRESRKQKDLLIEYIKFLELQRRN
jgi:hypothetical protein